ncbi:Gti1/Pac2 family-domain-containing protein [Flagelloscypha sp. PMI_526]|nr:Gti1/Pac2 family-domain-containing protein [Flagelloscypha sp. PMI_526]
MQAPTCTGLRIRSPSDARTIFHAVACNILPMITRRLDARDRNTISNGSIYVWEERSHKNDLTTVRMERWTDGIRWGPTRVRREGFLFYHQNQEYLSPPYVTGMDGDGDPTRMLLVKQTFTVTTDTSHGKRKWHLIAYFTPDKVDQLDTIDDRPYLASLVVPHERYKSATRGGDGNDASETSETEKSSPPTRSFFSYTPSHPSPPMAHPGLQSAQPGPYRRRSPPEHHVSSHPPPGQPPTRRRSGSSPLLSSAKPYPSPRFDATPDRQLAPLAFLRSIPTRGRLPTDQSMIDSLSYSPSV